MLTASTKYAEAAAQNAMNPIGQTGQAPTQAMNEDDFISEDELIDTGAELTQDDKVYLAMK